MTSISIKKGWWFCKMGENMYVNICIIGTLISMFYLLFIHGANKNKDREKDDQEQEKWIEEWRKRSG